MSRFAIENLFGMKGFNIAWYGVIIGLGILLGVVLACYRANKSGYESDLIFDFMIIALPVAIICARLYYVSFEWEAYANNPLKIFAIREGGLAIYGGVIGGFLSAIVFCKINKFSLLKLIDLVIPSLVLGQAIGRWGNFMNQEAYGELITNTKLQFFPYGVYIKAVSEWHQATFFYESMWNIILLILLLIIARKTKKNGILLATYFIGYGLGRLIIEGFRTDSLYLFGNIRVSQMLSLLLVIGGCILARFIMKRKIPVNDYNGKYLNHK
ncbi:prolipoprotein diacylglyceryl transferase [[Clostridium] fimetarium]|uniref:Phosphatidylglycerol--prolipoprotein diacylglyceryl transferase n=1 Tax=[Clostridium] fimetarium TaxID=99656 RepID=A0A1I0RTX1_9FIRM|nr:prolipoprotein diacylglyceryl transferase [[Clostridium] fimetarium]SEW44776.1 phosphatidylglycerol:prolipoprotein diacylglycerol transferase [[Clostridium] fimetarium]